MGEKILVNMDFPCMGVHKLFKTVLVVGVRCECESNNNTMYMVKYKKDYYWVYDYELKLIDLE